MSTDNGIDPGVAKLESNDVGCPEKMCQPDNPHLSSLDSDFLYHIAYSSDECRETFKDVKFVVAGGSPGRMSNFAEFIAKELNHPYKSLDDLKITKSDRFAFYKVGPVLSISHGMGVPSVTIMLHEILKLLYYAGAKDPIVIRIGTSGGIGVEAGTVIVTNRAFNSFLKESHDVVILGKPVSRPTTMDQQLAEEIFSCQSDKSFPTVLGGTMCTDDFYEGQGRLDGVICQYSEEDKLAYLQHVSKSGVSNIEMECTAVASLCHMTGVKCAVVCVALLNRLNGDQVKINPETYKAFSMRPQSLVASFIKRRIGNLK